MTSESPVPPSLSSTEEVSHRDDDFEGRWDRTCIFVFLHDNIHVVCVSSDGTMRKWDCDKRLPVGEPWEGEGGGVLSLALSPDGKTIACGRMQGSVQLWDMDGKMLESNFRMDHRGVKSLSWSPSGSHLASGFNDGIILIREAANGEVEMKPIHSNQDSVWSLAYSPSGDRIASGGMNQTICIWDSNAGELLVGPIKGLGLGVTSVVWSSDSSKLYSASDEFARVFDSVSGTLLHDFEHDGLVNCIALSPTNNLLACVGYGVAQLWDAETHQPLSQPLNHDSDRELLCCVSFSRDGQYLACGGDDSKVTLWMVTDSDIAPHPSSYLNVDATKPFARHGSDGIMGEGYASPYNNFFRV
ncbi:WD40 repeat-like protein [Rhizopogon salebrosus TDB-379]|nr:WD40 repeat-like protein [Rhizopogon salebrosus TDB-379]